MTLNGGPITEIQFSYCPNNEQHGAQCEHQSCFLKKLSQNFKEWKFPWNIISNNFTIKTFTMFNKIKILNNTQLCSTEYNAGQKDAEKPRRVNILQLRCFTTFLVHVILQGSEHHFSLPTQSILWQDTVIT